MVSNDSRFQQVADGLVLPAFVAGQPVLDYCNTRAGWGEPEPREYLTSYDHLVVWGREAGLVERAVAQRLRRAGGGENTLARALTLRSAIYDSSIAANDVAWGVVAAEAHRGAGWVIPEDTGLDLPLLAIARAAGNSSRAISRTSAAAPATAAAGCSGIRAASDAGA